MLVGAALAAVAALVLVMRSGVTATNRRADLPQEHAPPPTPVSSGVSDTPRELLAAWIQFLKSDLAEAVNALHNRLNVIAAHTKMEDRNLHPDQLHRLEQIRHEVARAASISRSLMHRVTGEAPETIPAVVHEFDGAPFGPADILLVENDEANRVVISKLFERLGHRVTAVTNGLQAFDILEQHPVDCVISDLRLPFVGGRTLFEQIEERLPHMASRFIFVTGDYTNPESRTFLEQSGQPVIGKPYEIESLLGAVAATLRKHHGRGGSNGAA